MKNKNLTFVNYLGLILCLVSIIYVFVIYLLMFVYEPFYAFRMYVGLGGEYFGKIFVCIGYFVLFFTMIPCLIAYTRMKYKNQNHPKLKTVGRILIAGAVVYFVLFIAFMFMLGNVFDGNALNPESTFYRFFDIGCGIALVVGLICLVGYTNTYDSFVELRKKKLRGR